MKTALIPPIPELSKYARGDLHLLLSHLMHNHLYFNWYRGLRERGSYLILDNSAHEFDVGNTAEELRDQAVQMRVHEVVVPDALFNGPLTVELAVQTLELWYEQGDTSMRELNPALMYVPQGKDLTEWGTCFSELIRAHVYMAIKTKGFRRSFVLGLSKDYDTWPEGLYGLLRDYVKPVRDTLLKRHEIVMQVHLLGWSRQLWNLISIARDFPWVRSIDSAKPFVYALDGVTLNQGRVVPQYPTRPEDYFSRELTKVQRNYATRNVAVFKVAAGGYL